MLEAERNSTRQACHDTGSGVGAPPKDEQSRQQEDPIASTAASQRAAGAMMESVDCWPLANAPFLSTRGGPSSGSRRL